MIVLDVNTLIAAHFAQHPHHRLARPFLQRSLSSDTVLVPDSVWIGFVRIATNPRIIDEPTSLAAIIEFIEAVIASGAYRHIGGLVDGLDGFLRECASAEASANLVPDAYIAAVARAHGCPVATFDRDFRRFDGVEIITPA